MTRQEMIKGLNRILAEYEYELDQIDREFLNMAIKALEQETVSRETYEDEFNLRKEFEMKVFELEKKMAEQESIIRCKDCKHWHEWENGTGACHRSMIWVGTDYDDYCSFAEPKGER